MRWLLLALCLTFVQAQGMEPIDDMSDIDVGRLLLLSFEGTQAPLAQLAAVRPAGFIFFSSNAQSAAQTRALTGQLQAAADYPLLFGIDQEGGTISTLRPENESGEWALFPGNSALGAAGDPALARAVGEAIGLELAYAGFNLNFAPVVDVASEPDNPVVAGRSFGSVPAAVAVLGAAFAAGMEDAGVAAVAKHFPGHGGTLTDSHLSLPVVTRSRSGLERLELPPFRALIDAGVPAVMSAHVSYPALGDLPATLSEPILTGLLRRELGFDGVVITDALNMRAIADRYGPGEAALRSVQAGADLLLVVGDEAVQNEVHGALQAALEDGRLSRDRVLEALGRSSRLAARYPRQNAPPPDALRPYLVAHRALAQKVAHRAATLLWNDGVLPIRAEQEILVVAPQPRGYGDAQHLGSVFKAARAGVRSALVSEEPTTAERAEAVQKAATADVVVLASYHGFGAFPEGLVALQADLAATAKPLVVVALGNPDDARFFSVRPDAYAAVYGYRDANLRAARDLILGRRRPGGQLPVPVATGSGETFPVGAGMKGY